MSDRNFMGQKVERAVEVYLDQLVEPKVLEEASLAQITKTLEVLLTRFSQAVTVPEKEDALSQGLRMLAVEMEKGNFE